MTASSSLKLLSTLSTAFIALTMLFTSASYANAGLLPHHLRVPPAIVTSSGIYSGVTNASANVESFKGVRYGAAPVGDLRFAAPLPVVDVAIKDASQFGHACPQLGLSDAFIILYGSTSLGADMNEDCLFLNIYRPAGTLPGANLPIMVWIHGGAYSLGSASQYDGTNMVKRSVDNGTPMIWISINYRLYVTGFLSSSILPPEDLNAGLLDQRLALKFIKDNAALFGGDSSKVTIWGQSAGASSVALQYLYPPSETLFRGAIENSGSGTILNVPTVEEYDAEGGPTDLLLSMTGCKTDSDPLSCLRSQDIQTLLDVAAVIDDIILQAAPGQSCTWLPTVGPSGSLIPERPSQRTLSGNFLRVPTITGTVQDEGTLFAINFLGEDPSLDDTSFVNFIKNRTWVLNSISDDTISELQSLYPPPAPVPPTNSPIVERLDQFGSDFHFVAPQRLFTDNAPSSQDIWVYKFNNPVPGTPDVLGSFHGSDLTYLQILNRTIPSAQSFSNQFMDYYINFVVNQDPGSSWPKFDPVNRNSLQLIIGNVTTIPDDVDLTQTDFLLTQMALQEFQH